MTNLQPPPLGGQRSGIETNYRGTLFRSRLEAKWAAFFDGMGWEWEYEPFDGDRYIPDFVLLGAKPVLVEVKPAPTLAALAAPLEHACERVSWDLWPHDILAVGLTPVMPPDADYDAWAPKRWGADGTRTHGHALGLLAQRDGWDGVAAAIWNTCLTCEISTFHHANHSYYCRLCGHYDDKAYAGDTPALAIATSWKAATNVVRWEAGGAVPIRQVMDAWVRTWPRK